MIKSIPTRPFSTFLQQAGLDFQTFQFDPNQITGVKPPPDHSTDQMTMEDKHQCQTCQSISSIGICSRRGGSCSLTGIIVM